MSESEKKAPAKRRVLVVREAFAGYRRGDVIRDAAEIERIERSDQHHHVYASLHDDDAPEQNASAAESPAPAAAPPVHPINPA